MVKKNEFLINKPIYLGFAVLEISKLLKYEIYYDKLQPDFVRECLQIHYMGTDSFDLGVNTKDIIRVSENLKVLFDFSWLNENHDLFSNRNKKVIKKFKKEHPKNIWIDEFVCLRSKMYSFKWEDGSKK